MAQELPPAVRRLFEGKNFAHLSTLMEDGSPQVTPVWVDCDATHILISTVEGHIKTKNVRRDPRVALSITNQENPYERAVIRGRVVDVTREGADQQVDRLAKKYRGVDHYQQHRPNDVRVIVRIEPLHTLYFGKRS